MTSEGTPRLKEILDRIRSHSLGTPPERVDQGPQELGVLPQGHGRADRTRSHLTTRLADVTPGHVSWLWPGRIPLGKITTLDGSPGLGKSTIALDLAARMSTGCPLPDGSNADLHGPVGVIVASAEDGASDTILPRVLAAGGDPKRIHLLRGKWVIPKDVPRLRDEILQLDVKLVILDPLASFLSPDQNMLQDQAMRNALGPLARIAEETGCAFVAVRHFTKTGGTTPLYRGGGVRPAGEGSKGAFA